MDGFLLFFLFVFFWITYSIVIWSLKNGIGPTPSSPKIINQLLEVMPSEISGKIYELGSGWGNLAFALAKKFPASQIIGYETSPFPYYASKVLLYFFGQKNIKFIKQDFFSVRLDKADLVVCYLYPGAMEKLENKFEAELKPGAWIISHTFALPKWKPIQVFEVHDLYHSKIYLYNSNNRG